ncbi:hypothetical protein WICMUC_003260 [Wickerhamomyces mucosus]|uniref:Uncharacterized protein n=1 Tax=Wickerhamomyces mucosus TaxID=1378264 RepID=A0A9P8PLL7_9ASCO|nr:hypothetical protein WICMUC_003260 [Wickerhamomyces mucosus]
MAKPWNSITEPVPPAVPITPITCKIKSFEVIPGDKSPSMKILMFLDLAWIMVWVAKTCSTSEVPIPKANEPNAPWVEVCESPQTTVVPGRVKPCSGPII